MNALLSRTRLQAPPTTDESSSARLQRKCACAASGESCPRCAAGKQAAGSKPPPGRDVPAAVRDTISSPGHALDESTRSFMESRFHRDFSGVRVHTDTRAAASAKAVQAHAYTVGRDIVFNAGRYAPGTNEGRRLLAHELTHVVQQSGGSTKNLQAYGRPVSGLQEERAEAEADSVAHAVSEGAAVPAAIARRDVHLAREEDRDREWQVACVKRLGGCANTRDAGVPDPEEIKRYNAECRRETGYEDDVTPTAEECNKPLREATKAELSYELENAPISSDPKKRVSKWLQKYSSDIVAAENRFQVDRRAIAGAIAWEAIENVRGAWTPSSVGPGKVHILTHRIAGENTVAKQIEDQGYLPKQSFDERKKILATPSGAINYIAAIMKAGADIAKQADGSDISGDPLVLTWFYNSKDLPGWREHLKKRKPGTPFKTEDNAMSLWVKNNLAMLEAAVGKPNLKSDAAKPVPLQKHPEDGHHDVADATERMLEAEADRVANFLLDVPAVGKLNSSVPHMARDTDDAAVKEAAAAEAAAEQPKPPSDTTKPLVEEGRKEDTKPDTSPEVKAEAPAQPSSTPLPPPATAATPCPAAPAVPKQSTSCATVAPAPGMAPPAHETAPAAPTLPSGDFGGDTTVTAFARELARCRSQRTVKGEIEERFGKEKTEAAKRAEAENKALKQQALEAAEAEARATTTGDKGKVAAAVAKARAEAAKKADAEAKLRKTAAVAGVTRQDIKTVEAELATEAFNKLAADYRVTMETVLRESGPGWSAGGLKKLTDARKAREKTLRAKPKLKKGETPPPEKSEADIAAELEAFMQQQRCEADARMFNAFADAKFGWMVGRREQLDFETVVQHTTAPASGFAAPRDTPEGELMAIPPELGGTSTMPGVAPEVIGFLRELQTLHSDFNVGNYAGHGSWKFTAPNVGGKGSHSMGFSIDITLPKAKTDARGFWEPSEAVDFLMKLDQAAGKAKAEWRVLYNDFTVAEEVNRRIGIRRVEFTGNIDKAGKLNWHGPAPHKLHFHLDIAPTVQLPTKPAGSTGAP